MEQGKELTANEKLQIVGDICKMLTEKTEQMYDRLAILQSAICICVDTAYIVITKRDLLNQKS
jgi:hypothetical protein